MQISLCMIVKNEEDTIARCINSVKSIVDEFIIVDTGSSDNTIEILKGLGIKPYNFKWVNDFSKARNYSFSQATKDYILWLDADDVFNPEDVEKFKQLKNTLSNDVDSVTMSYVLTRSPEGAFIHSLKRNRLVKRSRNFKWIGAVHEYLEVGGNIHHSDLHVIHQKEKEHTDRNLTIFENLIKQGNKLSVRDTFYYANELYYNAKYDKAIKQYKKFLDTNQGWIEDIRDACYKTSACYRAKEDTTNELKSLIKSFEYGSPRSDSACRIGEIFLDKNDVDTAIYWFNCAINLRPGPEFMGILSKDCYTFFPWLQLCVCYSRKGDMENSYMANEMAGTFYPDHPSVKYNRDYFESIYFKPKFVINNTKN